jgi:hypothetical protein
VTCLFFGLRTSVTSAERGDWPPELRAKTASLLFDRLLFEIGRLGVEVRPARVGETPMRHGTRHELDASAQCGAIVDHAAILGELRAADADWAGVVHCFAGGASPPSLDWSAWLAWALDHELAAASSVEAALSVSGLFAAPLEAREPAATTRAIVAPDAGACTWAEVAELRAHPQVRAARRLLREVMDLGTAGRRNAMIRTFDAVADDIGELLEAAVGAVHGTPRRLVTVRILDTQGRHGAWVPCVVIEAHRIA